MIDVNTVIGEPITTPDGILLVPVSKVSFGFGTGGGDGLIKGQGGFCGGSGAGVKIDPIGFLVVKDGNVRMLNITPPASSTVDRLVELIPDVVDQVEKLVSKHTRKD